MPTYLLLLFFLALWLWPPAASVAAASATVSPLQTLPDEAADTFTANSSYGSNLGALGATLTAGARASGFAKGSYGEAPDKVYGFVLCRGDYTGANCADGLRAAFQGVPERVFFRKAAVVYYDQYMLRFTDDERSFSNISNEPEWSANNMNSVRGSEAAERLMGKVVKLMNTMADLATSGSPRLTNRSRYATGEDGFGEQGVSTVYGLVQCRPDLTGPQCRSCLDGIIKQLPTLFMSNNMSNQEASLSRVGGRILGVRCNLRYEKDLFFEETSDTIKIDMPKNGKSAVFMIVIVGVPLLVLLILGLLLRPYIVKKVRVQGFREFMNEIKLIASLQHKNLVRLLGCCIKSKERILVYEYMPNGNLEEFIFGVGKKSWPVRHGIIEGIVEGLLYLHDYAHECIVHRDMKPSNILLDHEMNPKISDFGIARTCLSSVTESNTTTAMGTFGYIAPEYYSQNVYSTRSDVFSFGILVLEIISGKSAVGSYQLSGRSYELRKYAWQLWREQRCDELVDDSLGEEYPEMDVMRCIQIALLCVQDSAEDRPTMRDVTMMLSNGNKRLLLPVQPGSCSVHIDVGTEIEL
ncbi:cysteine-rich receptor-like protein kinase 3 isoform X2 [Triticum aestivum]|uniref:cysteine-rich receptor-like protein kinase 3 isoform X2 n=1 Tax=Triticum aestivum TaxID=4565 RepID=UPI001D0084A4|nr:cysteine-rich receptor-like protein kinase 3 isoform X2 [Triticum aestivum]